MIPYGRQELLQADIDAVVEVLRSDFLTQGPVVPKFEQAIADIVHVGHAVAMSNATSALHVSCLALGLGPGDLLWTVPNTYVASANCGIYCGADVDFVDIDPKTWNISTDRLREKLIVARSANRLPKVVVPVHFAGQPTDQEAIWELAQEFGFRVLEDASHSIGACRNGEPVGSCRWSDICVFSFHPVKIITTGEGGMALTNSAELAQRMAMYRNHGITRDASMFDDENRSGRWYYEQQLLGYNYRMTDIHAALGLSQLGRLDRYVQRRNELASRYQCDFADLPIQLPTVLSGNRSAFHLYVVRLKRDTDEKEHRRVFNELWRSGIAVNLHYLPVHLQPFFRQLGFTPGQFPEAESHAKTAITLPLYPSLSTAQQDTVVAAIRNAL